jgi:hypothetical protein
MFRERCSAAATTTGQQRKHPTKKIKVRILSRHTDPVILSDEKKKMEDDKCELQQPIMVLPFVLFSFPPYLCALVARTQTKVGKKSNDFF